mmetsp:Transcript_40195/g.74360  ORF Transcript_40195/g.74360 Transcript_40195/m.74360 type:complete len:120 (+) Transcript_40195:1037-1396(+)
MYHDGFEQQIISRRCASSDSVLSGSFQIALGSHSTAYLPFDISSTGSKDALQTLRGAGKVWVLLATVSLKWVALFRTPLPLGWKREWMKGCFSLEDLCMFKLLLLIVPELCHLPMQLHW